MFKGTNLILSSDVTQNSKNLNLSLHWAPPYIRQKRTEYDQKITQS